MEVAVEAAEHLTALIPWSRLERAPPHSQINSAPSLELSLCGIHASNKLTDLRFLTEILILLFFSCTGM